MSANAGNISVFFILPLITRLMGTISDMYAALRLLYARIGTPHVGTASYFSFNDPNGMCKTCSGIGKILDLDIERAIDPEKSWNEGMLELPAFGVGNYYWKLYTGSGLFDLNKKYRDYTPEERNLLLFGSREPGGPRAHKRVEGIKTQFQRLCLMKGPEEQNDYTLRKFNQFMEEKTCPVCHGRRLNEKSLSCKVAGYSIDGLCAMEFTELVKVLQTITDPRAATIVDALTSSLTRMIDIGLPYLSMDRESSTLSGGEAQRLKLVRYMGSSLTGMTYIFDEPSTGMHPRDVYRMTKLLQSLRDKGNTVLVVEHDKDVISIADEVIDVGPLAGKNGGQVLFQGSYEALLLSGTRTGNALKQITPLKAAPRIPKDFLPVRDACVHNLKNVSVDIPLNVLTVITGVAGSGKSSLIRDVFAKQYADRVVLVDQSLVTATGRSTPSTFLGFFDEIRKVMAVENGVGASLFSFNSKGGCPVCGGRGMIVTELVFMDPVTTVCEAYEFFKDNRKLRKALGAMIEVGLPYLSLGQPLSTLSGGERQRVKLAKYLDKKGNIYVLDEPTTGLHASDVQKVMELLDSLVDRGNTVIVIEHNLDVMKQADWLIDVGPDGGTAGGEIVFSGTPKEMAEHACTITAEYLRKSM